MKRREILFEGIYAGTALALLFWMAEVAFCLIGGGGDLLRGEPFPHFLLGESVRALPLYLLVSVTAGALFAAAGGPPAFVYAALLSGGIALFEWASFGDGALRLLWGAPKVPNLLWGFFLAVSGFLFLSFLRRKPLEEIRKNGLAAFLIFSLFLLVGQFLSIYLRTPFPDPRLKKELIFPVLYGGLGILACLSFVGIFFLRKWISPFLKIPSRQWFLFLFCLCLSGAGYAFRLAPPASSEQPNLIVIVLDTVRSDRLSRYGYFKKTSPTFDRLSEEGALFREAKATSHWTLPSHASLFTGLLPLRHGADTKTYYLSEHHTTLAETLRSQGYRTVGFTANGVIAEWTGLHRGFDQLVVVGAFEKRSLASRVAARLRGVSSLSAPSLNASLKQWLVYENRLSRKPFFLFVNYMEAHREYRFHPGVSEAFLSQRWPKKTLLSLSQKGVTYFLEGPSDHEAELRMLSDLYDGEIAYLDFFLGEFLDVLRQHGLLNRSILVVTSDHGEYFGEHGLISHLTGLYEEALHVPLLIRYPGVIPPGEIHSPAQLSDIAPTLLDLAGLHPLEGIDGESLVPLWNGGEKSSSWVIAAQSGTYWSMERFHQKHPDIDLALYKETAFSFQEGKYKIILSSLRPPEMYDLQKDKKEKQNLYSDEMANHPLRNRAALYLKTHLLQKPDTSPTVSAEKMRMLKSLGYL